MTGLRERIHRLLEEAGPEGLTVRGLMARLTGPGLPPSERTLRRILREMVREGTLVATTVRRGRRPGRSEKAYVLRRLLPDRPPLFALLEGVREAEVKTLDDLPPVSLRKEDGDILNDERQRREDMRSVLGRIAAAHLEEEDLARAVVEAAPDLAREDPVRLLVSMLRGWCDDLDGLARQYLDLMRSAPRNADRLREVWQKIEMRRDRILRYFGDLWRLEPSALFLPPPPSPTRLGWPGVRIDEEKVEEHLRRRVYGDRVVRIWELPDRELPDDLRSGLRAVVGTDSSVADIRIGHREGTFLPPIDVHIFSSAAAMEVRLQKGVAYTDYDIFPKELERYDEARAAEEGFLLSSRLREAMGEDDMRHARYAALYLRQCAQALRVLRREADWHPVGGRPSPAFPPRVDLIVADGRILPTVHRLKDYEADGLYGRLVRNQIAAFCGLFGPLRSDAEWGDVAYTGVVKHPEFSWLSPPVFWFLYRRGIVRDVDLVYRAPIPDPLIVHLLFLGLARRHPDLAGRDDVAFCTFGMIRRFSDIALERGDPRPADEDDLEAWEAFVRERLREAERRGRSPGLDARDYRPFLVLCAKAGVLMAYGIPCAVYRPLIAEEDGGHFLIPRLEVLAHLDDPKHPEHAGRGLRMLLAWMADPGRRNPDVYHRFPDEEGGLAPWVPTVVMEAHEAAGFVRQEMAFRVEDEIRRLRRVIEEIRSRPWRRP